MESFYALPRRQQCCGDVIIASLQTIYGQTVDMVMASMATAEKLWVRRKPAVRV